MLDKEFYAVVQLGGAVYGLGHDDIEAKFDAIDNLPQFGSIHELEDILVSPEDAVDGDYFVCECTQQFYDHVNLLGGNVEHNRDEDGLITSAEIDN